MIEAVVEPNLPEVGQTLDDLNTLFQLGSPRVYLPENSLKVPSGETMQIDGTLIVNGSLIGSGLPQPENPAEALNTLTDVSLGNIGIGESLKWNGERWTNQPDEIGLTEVALEDITDVDFEDLQNGDILRYDGSRWTNGDDKEGANRLSTLLDVDPSGLKDGATLQYNAARLTWEYVDETDFVDAIIDAGFADADLYYVDQFDIDGGFAVA